MGGRLGAIDAPRDAVAECDGAFGYDCNLDASFEAEHAIQAVDCDAI